MLSQKTIDTIKTITPLVAPLAETVTKRFYELLFTNNPEVSEYFNQANQVSGVQPKALADSICAYFINIDNLSALGPAVSLIANKHCSLGILPEHYPIVGKNLLIAIGEIMGDAATPEIVEAVAEAYGELANILIASEQAIYDEQKSIAGGWNGYRRFVVKRKQPESSNVTSFYLAPEDGGALPTYKPGQYTTVRLLNKPFPNVPRNYSLSDAPNADYFRISVKRENLQPNGQPAGIVSNQLHDEIHVGDVVELGPPCGGFVLDIEVIKNRPIVLLAGGVGITPLLSMVKHLAEIGHEHDVKLLHMIRNKDVHPFGDEVNSLSSKLNLHSKICYSDNCGTTSPEDRSTKLAESVHHFISKETDPLTAQYFVCGPSSFMASTIASLRANGVDNDRIAYEFFGPLQGLDTASSGKCPFH